MRFKLLSLLLYSSLALSNEICKDRVFNIKAEPGLKIEEIVNQIANE